MDNKTLQVSCLIASMLLAVNDARADGADVVNIPAGVDKIIPMRKGEASPIEGQLFDNDTALRWANWLVQYKQLVKSNAEMQRRICEIDVGVANQKLEIEKEKSQKVIPDLEKKLAKAQDEAQNPPFYKTFWFGATMGTTVTAVATIAVALLVSETK